MRIFAEDLLEDSIQEQTNVTAWMRNMKLIDEVKESDAEFETKAKNLLA